MTAAVPRGGAAPGGRGGRWRESYAERRARRSAIDDPELVLAAALRYLETRARSVHETRRRLTDAGYRPELVDGAVDRLTALGLLDDAAFARHWIESRDRSRPRGETALRRELRLRGVDSAVIEAALDERRSGDGPAVAASADTDGTSGLAEPDELAARRLLERRRRDLERVTDPRRRRARAYALLARNGFSPELAGRLAASFGAGTDEADEVG